MGVSFGTPFHLFINFTFPRPNNKKSPPNEETIHDTIHDTMYDTMYDENEM
jgi:hypothetical protein